MVNLRDINTGERSALKGACCVRGQAVGYQLGKFVNLEPPYKSRCWQSSLLDVFGIEIDSNLTCGMNHDTACNALIRAAACSGAASIRMESI